MNAIARPVSETLPVRRPQLDTHASSSHWLRANPQIGRALDALGVLIPGGERFFVRSVQAHAHLAPTPRAHAEIRAFIGQETQHGLQHHRAESCLVADGIRFERMQGVSVSALKTLERVATPAFCLSVTAGLEHLFASLGDFILREPVMDSAESKMRDLWDWHAIEEIEHKAVAFDLYRQLDPPEWHRRAGMLVGITWVFFSWLLLFGSFVRQDPGMTLERFLAWRRQWLVDGNPKMSDLLSRYARPYMRSDFHPNETDHREILARGLARLAARNVV